MENFQKKNKLLYINNNSCNYSTCIFKEKSKISRRNKSLHGWMGNSVLCLVGSNLYFDKFSFNHLFYSDCVILLLLFPSWYFVEYWWCITGSYLVLHTIISRRRCNLQSNTSSSLIQCDVFILERERVTTKDLQHLVNKIQNVSLSRLLEGFVLFGI